MSDIETSKEGPSGEARSAGNQNVPEGEEVKLGQSTTSSETEQSREELTDLGLLHLKLFRHFGKVDYIEQAVEFFSRAVTLTPDNDPVLPMLHACVAISCTDRYDRLGGLDDLEKAIEHHNRALELTPGGHPDLSSRHGNLGVSYTNRYRRLGGLDDLDKAIEHDNHALELTPNDDPDLSNRHANLGASYTDRYLRLGGLDDLEKEIEHNNRALELTPNDDPDLSSRHHSLGVSYTRRYEHLGERDDLEKAIEHDKRALELTPNGHPLLSTMHANLGESYSDRYQCLNALDDLEKAIEHNDRALELTPNDHPAFSSRHHWLGVSYTRRYEHLGELDDLEKAIKHIDRALKLTPNGHPQLPRQYRSRAYTFFLQYQHAGDPSHLNNALQFYRKSTQLSTGASRELFQNALNWAKSASQHSPLNCIEAYQTAIDLLPQFVWHGATTAQRYQDLETTEHLAINAARVAMLHSNQDLALEWLEHTRCIIWNQTLTLRTPPEQLQTSHPDISARFQRVSQQLHDAGSNSYYSHTFVSDPVDHEKVGQERRRLATEYTELLAQIRRLPGFEDFLMPMKSSGLIRAARNGPIVVINCHEDSCDALVISPGQVDIQHVPLPNFNQKNAKQARSELESSLSRRGLRQRGVTVVGSLEHRESIARVLLTLWEGVVEPVLDHLGMINDVPSDSLPHITWCPTGALSFLPLHAAGDYSRPGPRVFNYAISSYTPTLTALLASAPSTLGPNSRVLAVGQAKTPDHTPLPGTFDELKCLQAHIQNTAEYSQLIDDRATTTSVLDAMEKYDWVHLACHAHQNVQDPTKSGFFLHDGTLDLASINRRSFKNKGLAFLSACQTATGDEKLADEAVHLASGMLMAGYPSVIATMWSVCDTDAPFVADKVYAKLMQDGKVGNGEAGRALHDATAELRKKIGEDEFARWVPYIHIGS